MIPGIRDPLHWHLSSFGFKCRNRAQLFKKVARGFSFEQQVEQASKNAHGQPTHSQAAQAAGEAQ